MTVALMLGARTPRVVVTTSYDLALGRASRIAVHTSGGDITINPGPAGTLHVEAERVAPSEGAARALNVSVTSDGTTALVDWTGSGGEQHVPFTVTVPPTLPLQLDSGGGDLKIESVSGVLDGRTGGGSISVTDYAGTATLMSGGGHITFAGALSGQNVLQTVGGSIDASLPAQSRLVVTAQTGAGTLSNDFGLSVVSVDATQRRCEGMLGDGTGGSLRLATTAGNVRLHRE